MALTNYPNGLSSFGIPQLGAGDIPTGGGEYFFVDSNNGSDGYDGSHDAPLATLDAAVGKCTADKGSVIIVMPNHAESLTADSAVDIDVAGVTVVGLGQGDDRPTFTFTTAVTADFKLAANNVSIRNLVFVAGIDALTGPIEVSADYCSIINCEYQEDTVNNYETVDVIVSASTPLHMTIDGFKYVCDGGAGGTQNQSVIQLSGSDFAVIRNCHLVADSGTGVVEDAAVSDQILIENCLIESTNTGPVVAVFLQATTTGSMRNCSFRVASGTTYITAANDMTFFQCFGTGTDATAGELVGTGLSTDIESKIDTISSALSGTAGVATWADPARPADAVSISEAIRWMASRQGIRGGINPMGSVYYVAASGGNDAATGGGLDPSEPLATIAQAITNASAGDTVALGPGTHSVDVSASALVPKANLRFVSTVPSHGGRPTTIITGDADDGADLVTIDVDGVSFENVRFLLVAGGTTALRLVDVAQTTAVSGLSFIGCEFDLNDVDASGVTSINIDDATNATTGLLIKGCRFRGATATTAQAIHIDVGVGGIPSALIEGNIFECGSDDGDALAVNFGDPGAGDKSYGWTFRDNDVIGPMDYGNDGAPVVFAGAMTEGQIIGIVRGNHFSCCSATPITQDKANNSLINNYVGDAATGGTLVDPGT